MCLHTYEQKCTHTNMDCSLKPHIYKHTLSHTHTHTSLCIQSVAGTKKVYSHFHKPQPHICTVGAREKNKTMSEVGFYFTVAESLCSHKRNDYKALKRFNSHLLKSALPRFLKLSQTQIEIVFTSLTVCVISFINVFFYTYQNYWIIYKSVRVESIRNRRSGNFSHLNCLRTSKIWQNAWLELCLWKEA